MLALIARWGHNHLFTHLDGAVDNCVAGLRCVGSYPLVTPASHSCQIARLPLC